MNPALPLPVDADRYKLRLTAAWAASGVALWLLFPQAAPGVLPLCVVAPAAWYWAAERRLPLLTPSAVMVALALAGVYLLINASWSLSPLSAFGSVGLFFVIVAVLYLTLNALDKIDPRALRALAVGFLAGMMVAGIVLCFETFSGQTLRRLLLTYVPELRPNPPHFIADGDRVTMRAPYLLNPSISVLTLLLWPAILVGSRLHLSRRQKAGLLTALALGGATVFGSVHTTSKIAFVGAAATFGMFQVYPLLAKRLVIASFVAASLFMVPIASFIYSAEAYRATWLPESAKHRIVIWGYTSGQVAKAPFLGAGISTARALHQPSNPEVPRAPGSKFQLATSLHSHNAYLQVWYETGAVGALVLLGLGLLVLRALSRAPYEVQPYLYATFVTFALLAASSFSIWAPWFMASLGIVCAFAALGAALPAVPLQHATGDRVLGLR